MSKGGYSDHDKNQDEGGSIIVSTLRVNMQTYTVTRRLSDASRLRTDRLERLLLRPTHSGKVMMWNWSMSRDREGVFMVTVHYVLL